METIICATFPGTGKSFYINNSYGKTTNSNNSSFDKLQLPNDYISHVKSLIGKIDIIFVSSHSEVRKALINENMDFTLIYPNIVLKHEYLSRYTKRGSAHSFVDLLNKNWTNWVQSCYNQEHCKHVILKKGEYISDIINYI